MTSDKISEVANIIEEFEQNCELKYQNIIDVSFQRRMGEGSSYEIHVEIEENGNAPPTSFTYCHSVAEFGREHGLYLWDTITDWEKETVTLRFRFND
jgi:hypothetical protein